MNDWTNRDHPARLRMHPRNLPRASAAVCARRLIRMPEMQDCTLDGAPPFDGRGDGMGATDARFEAMASTLTAVFAYGAAAFLGVIILIQIGIRMWGR